MLDTIKWLNDALAGKELVQGMTYYRVDNKEIRATDSRITASHPWPYGGSFLVPGDEFEKVLARMPGEVTITQGEGNIKLSSGRFRGTINTLPLSEWDYPGVEVKWKPLPKGLIPILKALRPFISDNAVQGWAMSVALSHGWAFATNNVALAGAPVAGLDEMDALLPVWAVDFVTRRAAHLTHWAWAENYVAFKWKNGAWMRSQLTVGKFPDKAANLVKDAHAAKPTQEITKEFREAFEELSNLAEDTIEVYPTEIRSKFGKAEIVGEAECETPKGAPCSVWGARFLAPVIEQATMWQPSLWPAPVPFHGDTVSGYVVGRKV